MQQWTALNGTGIRSSSSADRPFQEWGEAGTFLAMGQQGLYSYEEFRRIAWDRGLEGPAGETTG